MKFFAFLAFFLSAFVLVSALSDEDVIVARVLEALSQGLLRTFKNSWMQTAL